MTRVRRWGMALLAVSLASCATQPPAKPVIMGEGWCVPGAFRVTAIRLDTGAAVDRPDATAKLYPDRAQRMLDEGDATYDCRFLDGGVACAVVESHQPGKETTFGEIGPRLSALLSTAEVGPNGVRVKIDFRVLAKPYCY